MSQSRLWGCSASALSNPDNRLFENCYIDLGIMTALRAMGLSLWSGPDSFIEFIPLGPLEKICILHWAISLKIVFLKGRHTLWIKDQGID